MYVCFKSVLPYLKSYNLILSLCLFVLCVKQVYFLPGKVYPVLFEDYTRPGYRRYHGRVYDLINFCITVCIYFTRKGIKMLKFDL